MATSNAKVQVFGGGPVLPIEGFTEGVTPQANNYTLLMDATVASRIVTLPPTSAYPGRIYAIKRIDVSANTVTITPSGTDTIDGVGSLLLTSQMSVFLQSDGEGLWSLLASFGAGGGGGGVTGTGTPGFVPLWTTPTNIGDSVIQQAAGNIGIGAAPGAFKLDVTGDVRVTGKLTVTGAIDPTSVLLSGSTALFYESNNGSTAPVSGAATGRIRYNNTNARWEKSTQGSAYSALSTPEAATFVVDDSGNGDFTTIEAAVAAAPVDGADIYVREGTYAPAATISLPTDRNIKIRGAGRGIVAITCPINLPLFTVPGGSTADYHFSGFTFSGNNSTLQALISIGSAVDVIFDDIDIADMFRIIVTTSTPDVLLSRVHIDMTTGGSTWSYWSGASGGTFHWVYVESTISTQSTGGLVGDPDWDIVDSYIGGGGPLTTTMNIGKLTILGMRADKVRFIIGSAGSRIVNLEAIDCNVTLNNNRTSIANSTFTTPTLSGTQVSVHSTGGAGGQVYHTIAGCSFDSDGVTGTNFQIEVSDVQGLEVTGCSFSENGTGAGTDANIGVGDTGGTTELTVVGCQFFGGTPAQAVLEFAGLGTITGHYTDNIGFDTADITSPFSTVNGVQRYGQTAGATTGAFVTLFTHENTRGLLGIGTIKNTGGVNALEVRETAIDAFGVTDTAINTVLAGADRLLDEQVNIGTARPPYVSYAVAVQHPVAATTFDIQHASNGAQS